jgi:hypothetical protein
MRGVLHTVQHRYRSLNATLAQPKNYRLVLVLRMSANIQVIARDPKLLSIKKYWDNDLKIYIHIPATYSINYRGLQDVCASQIRIAHTLLS